MNELIIKLTGNVVDSNFDEWKGALIEKIREADKQLVTDEDFTEADTRVKQFSAAEKSLLAAKESALEQAADIQKLFASIDEVSAEARKARLSLEKQIKTRKQEIRDELIREFVERARALVNTEIVANKDFDLVRPQVFDSIEFEKAIKGKRSIVAMRQALDEVLQGIHERMTAVVTEIAERRNLLNKIDPAHRSLYQDEKSLLSMGTDVLEITIEKRITEHEANEAKRKLAEKEKAEQKPAAGEATEAAAPKPAAPAPAAAEPEAEKKPEPPGKDCDFEIYVQLQCDLVTAKEIGAAVDKAVGSRSEVTKIRLLRGEGSDQAPKHPSPPAPEASSKDQKVEAAQKADWSALVDREDVLIFDTETTGLGDDAEIVELSIIDTTGKVLFDELVMPKGDIPEAAFDIHGIDLKMLKQAKAHPWPDHHNEVMHMMSGRVLLSYNLAYDVRLLRQTVLRYRMSNPYEPPVSQACVMVAYAEHRKVPGPRGGYRWHKLTDALKHEGLQVEGQAHRALTDCRATLELVRFLAKQEGP